MDYYQGVVIDFLRADRTVFVNTECCIQLNEGPNPDVSGPHWYCDAVAVDFRKQVIFLCEISYAKNLASMIKRLRDWAEHWPDVCRALRRDCHLPEWDICPWLFVPEELIPLVRRKLAMIAPTNGNKLPEPRIEALENVQPWRFSAHNRSESDANLVESDMAIEIA